MGRVFFSFVERGSGVIFYLSFTFSLLPQEAIEVWDWKISIEGRHFLEEGRKSQLHQY